MKFGKPESKAEAIAMCMSSMNLLLNIEDDDEKYRLACKQAMEIFPKLFEEELEVPDHPNEDDDHGSKRGILRDIGKVFDDVLTRHKATTIHLMSEGGGNDSIAKLSAEMNKAEEAKQPAKQEKKSEKKNSQKQEVVEEPQDAVPAYEEAYEVNDKPADGNANMGSGNAKIDLGTGMVFDPDSINEEVAARFDPSNPARAFIQDHGVFSDGGAMVPGQVTGYIPNPIGMPIPQQQMIPASSIPQQALFPQQMAPQQPVITQPPVKPLHKVDEPPKQSIKIADPDKVEVDLNKVDIDDLKKEPTVQKKPEFIQPMQAPAPGSVVTGGSHENLYDNSAMIAKFNKIPLKEIEEIAAKNGVDVIFEESPHIGLISVVAVAKNNTSINPKCFTIDTGMIIDKRVKLIDACPRVNPTTILENGEFYEVFNTIGNKSHAKKVLDEKLFNDIFYGGLMNISKRPMYSKAYKDLNLKLALITMPTRGLNAEERSSLQEYIVKMDNDGYFDKAISNAPGSRFVFTQTKLDKEHLSNFTLTNEGVPAFYGAMYIPVNPVIIESKDGHIDIRCSQNTQPAPVTQSYPTGDILPHGVKCNCGHC